MRTLAVVLVLCLATAAYGYRWVGPRVNQSPISRLRSGGRVIGGAPASPTQAPFQVSLLSVSWFGESHICGGSLVGSRTVVTAAHCCEGSSASALTVKYGGVDRTNLATTNPVTEVIIHNSWNSATIDSDYCVLRLQNTVVTGNNVAIIPIATATPATGTVAHLTGWGRDNNQNNNLPTQLQYVQMNILGRTECHSKWSDVNPITSSMICAESKTASGCNGDSGGPLQVNGELVGIVSWGANGCPADTTVRPTVYADPAASRAWLISNIV